MVNIWLKYLTFSLGHMTRETNLSINALVVVSSPNLFIKDF
jgi:hypothetical protein